MRRREFITLLGGAAAGWPPAARAQQPDRRRIGILSNKRSDDPEGQDEVAAFIAVLDARGWRLGRNLQIEWRWYTADAARTRKDAEELAAQAPDVIVAITGVVLTAVVQTGRTIPVVFGRAVDPVGAGYVASLARPGGNVTGFILFEYALAAKWLQLLKEIAPNVTRTAVLRHPTLASGVGQFAAIQAVGSIDTELTVIDIKGADQIGRDIASFAHVANGGLIMTANPFGSNHPDVMVAAAARHKLPAVYSEPYYVKAGGLIAYGHDVADDFQRAAGYVDRILKGEKPADLPVQAPTKYELIINLKAAKAIGLGLPASVLARADEVIE